MRPWQGLGARVITAIKSRAARKRLSAKGPLGDFYRGGGNIQIYEDLPLGEDDLVVDAGGYRGEWTAGVLTRYGCRSEIFEPVPAFADQCRDLFRCNTRVRVHQAALGGRTGSTIFSLADNGTSEFRDGASAASFEAQVLAIGELLQKLNSEGYGTIGCLKLNIEGGEYEVLEHLLETGQIRQCRSLLIQFHCQPPGWEMRREAIVEQLQTTHQRAWCYPMVWEKWLKRSVA